MAAVPSLQMPQRRPGAAGADGDSSPHSGMLPQLRGRFSVLFIPLGRSGGTRLGRRQRLGMVCPSHVKEKKKELKMFLKGLTEHLR